VQLHDAVLYPRPRLIHPEPSPKAPTRALCETLKRRVWLYRTAPLSASIDGGKIPVLSGIWGGRCAPFRSPEQIDPHAFRIFGEQKSADRSEKFPTWRCVRIEQLTAWRAPTGSGGRLGGLFDRIPESRQYHRFKILILFYFFQFLGVAGRVYFRDIFATGPI
jgi:hypothetical protein